MSEFKFNDPFEKIKSNSTSKEVEEIISAVSDHQIFPTNDKEEKKKIYRKFSKKYHPDVSQLEASITEEIFKRISNAYDTKSSFERKKDQENDQNNSRNRYSQKKPYNKEKNQKYPHSIINKIYKDFKSKRDKSVILDEYIIKIIDIEKRYNLSLKNIKSKMIKETLDDLYEKFEAIKFMNKYKWLSSFIKIITDIEKRYNVDFSDVKKEIKEKSRFSKMIFSPFHSIRDRWGDFFV